MEQATISRAAPEHPTLERAAVIAVGGNALIGEGQQGTIAEQFENARATAHQMAALAATAGTHIVADEQ